MAQKKPSPPTLDPLLTHYTDEQVATIKATMTGFDDPAAALHSVAGIAMGLLYSVPETVMEPSNVRDRQEVKRDLVRKTKHLLQVVRELQEAMEEFPDELIEKLNVQFSGYPADPQFRGRHTEFHRGLIQGTPYRIPQFRGRHTEFHPIQGTPYRIPISIWGSATSPFGLSN